MIIRSQKFNYCKKDLGYKGTKKERKDITLPYCYGLKKNQ